MAPGYGQCTNLAVLQSGVPHKAHLTNAKRKGGIGDERIKR